VDQATAVEGIMLTQRAWLRQAERASPQKGNRFGSEADQLSYSILCTRMHLPGLEAATATLKALAEIESHVGADAVDQLLNTALAAARRYAPS
jgi:hypothetical protein